VSYHPTPRAHCWFHVWGIERGYRVEEGQIKARWFRGVPDGWVGSMEVAGGPPQEKVCGRCGKRKQLRWGFRL
jgi:hypothetical protein